MTDDPKPESDSLDAMEARMEELLAGRTPLPETPTIDDEMDKQLRDLEKRAKQAKGHSIQNHDFAYQKERGQKYHEETGKGLADGIAIAYVILGAPILGWGIGWLADRGHPGEGHWQKIGAIIGMVIGVILTIMLLNRNKEK